MLNNDKKDNSDVKLIPIYFINFIEILLVLVYSKSIIHDEQHYQNR